jgi:hypothetical protein
VSGETAIVAARVSPTPGAIYLSHNNIEGIPMHGPQDFAQAQPGVVAVQGNGVYCAHCGATPAAHAELRGHRGFLIFMQFRKTPGPFCRDCGLATYRRMTEDSLLFGWWGPLSLWINGATMLLNLLVRAPISKLAPPIPGSPGQPMDPGKPLLRRPAAIAFLIPLIAYTTIIIAVLQA